MATGTLKQCGQLDGERFSRNAIADTGKRFSHHRGEHRRGAVDIIGNQCLAKPASEFDRLAAVAIEDHLATDERAVSTKFKEAGLAAVPAAFELDSA